MEVLVNQEPQVVLCRAALARLHPAACMETVGGPEAGAGGACSRLVGPPEFHTVAVLQLVQVPLAGIPGLSS